MFTLNAIKTDTNELKKAVKFFQDNGYLKIQSVVPAEKIDEYLAEVERIDAAQTLAKEKGNRSKDFDYNYYNFSGAHYYNTTRYSRSFDDLVGNPDVVSIVEEIMGVKCILSQTELRNNRKNKTDSYAFNWHRDGRMILDNDLWIIAFWPLNEITETNGPTELKINTHRNKNNDQVEDYIKLTASQGDVVLMSANSLHRASVNTDGKDRWVYIPTYNSWFVKPSVDHTKYFTKEAFDNLTETEKQIYGFTSIVPSDERKRIYTLRPWQESIDEIQFANSMDEI